MNKMLERVLEPLAIAAIYGMVMFAAFFALATFYVVIAREFS